MKYLFTALVLFVSFNLTFSQNDMPLPDSATIVQFPWFDNNEFLDDFMAFRGGSQNGANANSRPTCANFKYEIPVVVRLWRNSNNDASSNITVLDAEAILNQANLLYENAGTNIHFFLNEPVRIETSNNYNNDLDDAQETLGFFASERSTGVVNIHMVDETNFQSGYAVTPYYPSVPLSRWSCYISTSSDLVYDGSLLAHELGHVFGLLHTHHPGRLPSLAFNDENATINNICYQETVYRAAENRLVDGCLFTVGKDKCGINGDFLCDTEADPGMTYIKDVNGTVLKYVSPGCNFQNFGMGNDYDNDNFGIPWTPPVHNIMSYSNENCTDEFSPRQIGQMWYYIEKLFYNNLYEPSYSTQEEICSGGRTITLNNPLNGMSIDWTANPPGLIQSATSSGTGTSAFIKAANTLVQGWATVSFFNSASCDIFYIDTLIWVGKPLFNEGEISGPATLVNGNSATFASPAANQYNYYQWVIPSGLQIVYGQGTKSIRLKAKSTGLKLIELRAYNDCGYTRKYQYVEVTSSSSGGGGGGGGSDPCNTASLSLSPNPSGGQITARVIYPGGGGDPCDDWLAIAASTTEDLSSVDSFSMKNIEKDGEIVITNHIGEIVYQKMHRGKNINLRLHKLPSGVYLINYMYNGEELISSRFIRQ